MMQSMAGTIYTIEYYSQMIVALQHDQSEEQWKYFKNRPTPLMIFLIKTKALREIILHFFKWDDGE